eukprot:gene27098-32741_t
MLKLPLCHVSVSEFRIVKEYSDSIWLPAIHKTWNQLQWNAIPRDIYNLFERIKQLPISKLKKALVGIDLQRCVEKVDYQRMLLAHLVFNKHMKKELAGTDVRFAGKYLTRNYPEWSLRITSFKASYVFAVQEIQRKEMLVAELTACEWAFTFKDPTMTDMPNHRWMSKFYENGTMESEMQPDYVYSWRVVTTNSSSDAEQLCIQVDSYPVLTASRMTSPSSRGRWRLDNMYVTFLQSTELDNAPIPLL